MLFPAPLMASSTACFAASTPPWPLELCFARLGVDRAKPLAAPDRPPLRDARPAGLRVGFAALF
jgi:hypothetical protein